MKSFKVHYFTTLLILLFCAVLNGQTAADDLKDTKISILTCRSGNELYSTFGHTAIRVQNIESRLDIVYNYGVFSFNTPYFYIKFMRGQLPYFLLAYSMDNFLREYNYEKRSVFEQVLELNSEQKKKMLSFLVNNALPENREYNYDFFYDNCATRVVDVYSLVGDVEYNMPVEEKTFRDLLKENLKSLVWSDFGIDIVIGARADKLTTRRHQMFLPEYVMSNLSTAKIGDSTALASSPYLVLDFESLNGQRKKSSTYWPLWLMMGMFVVVLLVNILLPNVAQRLNKAVLISSGVLGLFLLFMWFGTNHAATRDNWNILWLNPLVLMFFYTKGKVRVYLGYLLLVLLLISGLNCLVQFLPQFFNLAFLPIILTISIALYMHITKKSDHIT